MRTVIHARMRVGGDGIWSGIPLFDGANGAIYTTLFASRRPSDDDER